MMYVCTVHVLLHTRFIVCPRKVVTCQNAVYTCVRYMYFPNDNNLELRHVHYQHWYITLQVFILQYHISYMHLFASTVHIVFFQGLIIQIRAWTTVQQVATISLEIWWHVYFTVVCTAACSETVLCLTFPVGCCLSPHTTDIIHVICI